ncbi:uncharacterized protein LOC114391986 isoform X7 [Glycine soja]|uniref:uncharacterized protein LOC114391986 isoform X7 n=1 Tax=Glycine soja TaxID=3848 RepID=UPI00103D09B0|nr:uncharacterized protein LOC114391986 isoform X7 [Glycine soja]
MEMLFACAFKGWGFWIRKFAEIYASKVRVKRSSGLNVKIVSSGANCQQVHFFHQNGHVLIICGIQKGRHIVEMLNLLAVLQKETLSDIDDEEVDLYIHDEEGKHIKKILWETANREYLEEQAAKEAAAAASKKAFEAKFENCSEDILAARELAASSTEAVAKSKKEMRQKRAYEAKNTRPAQSAAETFGQMSNKKREQAAKEVAAAINKKAFEAKFENCSEDILAARELGASSTEAVAKSRKLQHHKRPFVEIRSSLHVLERNCLL